MKLMIVGSDKVYAIENFYTKYMKGSDVELLQFPAQSIFYDYYQKNILNKLLFKAGLSRILQGVNEQFKARVTAFRPDVIWIFKGMEIFPSSLAWAKQQNIKLVNYNPDNPFIFTGKGSGNKNVTNSLPLFDLHLTYNMEVQRELQARFQTPAAILPFGFDLDEKLYELCSEQSEVKRVCFLGNPDEQRVSFLKDLAATGLPLDLYGHGWKQYMNGQPVKIYDPVYADDFWKVLRRYRVQLNLMRIHNEDSHNMRSFETPGVGGIMLAPATKEHRLYFKDQEEVFLFNDLKDCADQAGKILQMDAFSTEEVRKKARRRSIASGYSYKDRAAMVLEQFRKLCEN